MICLIGNVSQLPGNISLIPDAEPDDGLLDVYVASPHRITHWFRVFLRLITRRRHGDDRVDQWRGRRVEVRLNNPDSYQLDGDVVGEMHHLGGRGAARGPDHLRTAGASDRNHFGPAGRRWV